MSAGKPGNPGSHAVPGTDARRFPPAPPFPSEGTGTGGTDAAQTGSAVPTGSREPISGTDPGNRFEIHLKGEPSAVHQALKWIVKVALRRFGLRVAELRPIEEKR